MRHIRKSKQVQQLQEQLADTNSELGYLNRALAIQMISLATQTGETEPLSEAVTALRSAQAYYSFETCPREHAEIQQALADTLLLLGKANQDKAALEKAKQAYRGAITLASMLGDERMRADLRSNYKLTMTLLGQHTKTASLFKVA
ncbi:hypothetical protein ACJ3XI_02935 [Litorimonas sp. RW-G-Af-16]|uniref:hypothetical protein n=1 Tax=Litorimonas sp. RW-G-Af-16 TaxID=3241168 RepID=UPI00390C7101